MKYNSKYRVAKQCADGWDSGDIFPFLKNIEYLNEYYKQHGTNFKLLKLFLKRLRKINKPLWHKIVD